MLTADDIKQLKTILATKEDLKVLEARMENKFVTTVLFDNATKELLDFLGDFRQDFEDFRNEFKEFKEDVNDVLESHERRLDKVEDKIFP